ncbi:hypothetical protein D9M71_493950 [compost metagenome]
MIFSVTTGFRFNCANGVTDHAGIAVYRTGCPVALADFVEHRPTNADTSVGFETGALARVVLGRYFEQADHAGLDQILDLDAGRQARQQVVGDALDQRCVTLDQLVLRVARSLAVHAITAGTHEDTDPVLVCCTRRSTKNSRCPRGLAGNGQVSTFCAMALNASAHLERGNAS